MGSQKRSRDSSDRENWDRIFNTFVKALEEREEQLESLYKDRKILEDRIKRQHERWVSDVQNFEDQLSLMKNETETLEMMQLIEIANCKLLLGLKERDLSLCKSKLEKTQDELDDYKAWFDILTLNKNREICNSGDGDECKSLEAKIRKLKLDFEKLAFGKRCKVSTVLREAGLAWSGFKHIESGFTEKLMRKEEEIKQANKNISSLEEQFQSSTHEKDKIISGLMAKVAELEENASKKTDGEILRLPHEVKPLRRSRRLNRRPLCYYK